MRLTEVGQGNLPKVVYEASTVRQDPFLVTQLRRAWSFS